jgi:hypothetical protein
LAAGQTELDLALSEGLEPGTLPIASSQMTQLWDGLCAAYRVLGFEAVTKGDTVFRDLVLARIIEPTSKIDARRVLSEVGVEPVSYATVKRRLPVYARPSWRQSLATQALGMPDWGRGHWCCSTSRRCTSRLMPVTDSVSPGSPRRGCAVRRLLIEWR